MNMVGLIGDFFRRRPHVAASNQAVVYQQPEPPLTKETETALRNLISLNISYFNSLTADLQKLFLYRVHHFRSIKHFHYIGMEELLEIPILISAAAVQLTLGLEKFELHYFHDIFITPDAYRFSGESENGSERDPSQENIFVGHVSPTGIYISWKYFLQGYADTTDNVNVAIHELAHALEHESFMEEAGVDPEFRHDFAQFSTVCGPAFAKRASEAASYLRDYAFTNVQEFWAVSVEAFFENPTALKEHMPELYGILCAILNQDPLTDNKILKKTAF
jgi:Mlc titration factor MtfA (ptsG expression regulator)